MEIGRVHVVRAGANCTGQRVLYLVRVGQLGHGDRVAVARQILNRVAVDQDILVQRQPQHRREAAIEALDLSCVQLVVVYRHVVQQPGEGAVGAAVPGAAQQQVVAGRRPRAGGEGCLEAAVDIQRRRVVRADGHPHVVPFVRRHRAAAVLAARAVPIDKLAGALAIQQQAAGQHAIGSERQQRIVVAACLRLDPRAERVRVAGEVERHVEHGEAVVHAVEQDRVAQPAALGRGGTTGSGADGRRTRP